MVLAWHTSSLQSSFAPNTRGSVSITANTASCAYLSGLSLLSSSSRLPLQFVRFRITLYSTWPVLTSCSSLAFASVKNKDAAAILEWVVSLLYICYVASFIMDFLPAIHSKHNRFPSIEMGINDVNGPSNSGGPVYAETYSNASYGSNQPMQEANPGRYTLGSADAPPSGEGNVAPSRNF